MTDTTSPNPPLSSLFIEAAWLHAKSFMSEKGIVPDVVILGVYATQEMEFVFPSGQDKDSYVRACQQEAASTAADIAIYVGEAWVTLHPAGTDVTQVTAPSEDPQRIEIVQVAYLERGTSEIRTEFSHILRDADGSNPRLGPPQSHMQAAYNRFLQHIFGAPTLQ